MSCTEVTRLANHRPQTCLSGLSYPTSHMAPNDDGRGHILLEPYCILCRNHAQFARQTVAAPENPVNPELWEKVVLCCEYMGATFLGPLSIPQEALKFY